MSETENNTIIPNEPQVQPLQEVIPVASESAPMIAPEPVKIQEVEREIAYVINDKNFGEFVVGKSANAWWMEREKVADLIKAFKSFMTVKQACTYAGISPDQWRYFSETHPDFSRVKEACLALTGMKARIKTVELIEQGDGSHIRWFLAKTEPEQFGDAPATPINPIGANFGTVINNTIAVTSVKPSVLKAILDKRNSQQQ